MIKLNKRRTLLFLLYNIFAAIIIMTMFFLKHGSIPTGSVIFISLFCILFAMLLFGCQIVYDCFEESNDKSN